jgi:hypothetical protein
MSRDKLIIIGAVLLGLLGVLVYKQAKRDESMGHPSGASAELASLAVPGDVDKISVTNGDKPEVVLELVPNPKAAAAGPDAGSTSTWVLTKPLRAEANQSSLKDLVANMVDLKIAARVNLRLDEETRKEKQLDAAHAVHVIAWKGADKKLDALFGKSGAIGELAVLGDKPNDVWAIKGYSSYLYTKEPKDFRNKEIFHFDDANVFHVTVSNAHGTLTFSKGGDGKWAGTIGNKPIERFDQEKVKDMMRAYKLLSAEEFGDGKSPAETGLDKPEGEAAFQLTGDAIARDLLVGKVGTGTNRWARRADGDAIYQITNYAAEWLTGGVSKYQSAVADAGAGDSGAKAPAKKK